jgi:hypothetical protein
MTTRTLEPEALQKMDAYYTEIYPDINPSGRQWPDAHPVQGCRPLLQPPQNL